MPDSRASTRTARERTVAEKVSSRLLPPCSFALYATLRGSRTCNRYRGAIYRNHDVAVVIWHGGQRREGSSVWDECTGGGPACAFEGAANCSHYPPLPTTYVDTHLRSNEVTHLSTVAVGTFMVAVELDLKRRENDKKINLLFDQMRDMMSVLAE